MSETDDITNALTEITEGMTFDERILWIRKELGLRAAQILISEARHLLIQRDQDNKTAARNDDRRLEEYLELVRVNEREDLKDWLAERMEDEAAATERAERREQHKIDEYIRRIRADRRYRERLQADLDFEEVVERQKREGRDLDDFFDAVLILMVCRALRTRVIQRDQFRKYIPKHNDRRPVGHAPAHALAR
jgi:uncharacterized glyoxalase superfamily metalloenzyme YdcJ